MISEKSRRISITIDKELDDAINKFLKNSGQAVKIYSKSHLFVTAVVDWFGKLNESIQEKLNKMNTKKGD